MPQANRSCIPHLYPQFGYIKTGGVKAFGSKTNCFILSLQCKRFLLIQPAFNTLHAGSKIQYGERNDTCSTSDQARKKSAIINTGQYCSHREIGQLVNLPVDLETRQP